MGPDVIINKREVRKRIHARAERDHFKVVHDMPGEQIFCAVPTLELAGTIVAALRERAYIRAALALLKKHQKRKEKS